PGAPLPQAGQGGRARAGHGGPASTHLGDVSRSGPVTDSKVDGRTARAERTRRAIVDALLALIAEGDLKASPERIVARAGVSLRTLWSQFKDLEGLYAAANARLIERLDEQHRVIDPALPLGLRVDQF